MKKFTIKFFNSQKGFGFATADGADAYYHASGYRRPVRGPRGVVEYREAKLPEKAERLLFEGVRLVALETVAGEKGPKLTAWYVEQELAGLGPIYLVLEPKAENGHGEVLTPIFIGPREEADRCAAQYADAVLMAASVDDLGYITRCELQPAHAH